MPPQQTTPAVQVDWRNDPNFAKLSLADKHAVLLRIDPDYAQLPGREQVTALRSIHYGRGAGGPPTSQAEFDARQERDYARAYDQPGTLSDFDTASIGLGAMQVGKQVARQGIRKAGGRLIKGLLGASGGAAAGRYGGRGIGEMFGEGDLGERVGATVGGVAGGMYGARGEPAPPPEETPATNVGAPLPSSDEFYATRGAELDAIRQQSESLSARIARQQATTAKTAAEAGKAVPVSQSPSRYRGPSSIPKPSTPPTSPFPTGSSSSQSPSWQGELPQPQPQQQMPTIKPKSTLSSRTTEGVKGSVAKPSGRLVLLPEEAQAEEQMQRVAERRASQHGMQYAGGMRPSGTGKVPMTPTGTTTEPISALKQRVPIGESPSLKQRTAVAPSQPPIAFTTDSNGVRWASTPDGIRVSIKGNTSISEARAALDAQRSAQQALKQSLTGATQ